MARLTKSEIVKIQLAAIAVYTENMKVNGESKTAQGMANARMAEYENAITENGMVIGYYNNGFKEIPKFPKYAA